MLLDEIAARISGSSLASSSGANGWYLWKSELPDSTALSDKALAIIATGGLPQIPNVKVDQPTFQILIRGARIDQVSTAYQEAALLAEQVKMNLHFLGETSLSGVTYHSIQATGEPGFLGEDNNRRPMFSCNFMAYRDSTSST